MGRSFYVIVVGCGRLGSRLANQLSARGHRVVVIDGRPSAFDALSAEFSGYRVIGDAVESAVLKEAGIDRAEYVFATTDDDNVNLMVAQVARNIYNVRHVVARIYDPTRESIYQEFDIKTVNPVQLSGDAFLRSCSLLDSVMPEGKAASS